MYQPSEILPETFRRTAPAALPARLAQGPGQGGPPGSGGPVAGAVGRQVPDAGKDAVDYALDISKGMLCLVISEVPVVGPIAAVLLDVFWPFGEKDTSVWDSIEAQVEKVVDTKLTSFYQELVGNTLKGLRDQIAVYSDMVTKARTPQQKEDARNTWTAIHSSIVQFRPQFLTPASPAHTYDVLPLMVQFANLHALLLRDLLHNADLLGWEKEKVADVTAELTTWFSGTTIEEKPYIKGVDGGYIEHVKQAYLDGIKATDDWQQTFDFQRVMYVNAIEYAVYLWPLLAEPASKPTSVDRNYQIFLGPVGEPQDCDEWSEYKDTCYPWPAPPYRSVRNTEIDYINVSQNTTTDFIQWWKVTYKDGTHNEMGSYTHKETWQPAPGLDALWMCGVNEVMNSVAFGGNDGGWESDWFGADIPYVTGIKKWVWRKVYIPGFRVAGWWGIPGRYDSWFSTMIAYLPKNPVWKPENVPGPVSTASYTLVSADTRQALDLARVTRTGDIPASLAPRSASRIQEWQLQATGDSTWRLVNQYTKLPLVRTGGQVSSRSSTDLDTEDVHWNISVNKDGTHRIHTPAGQSLATGPDNTLVLADAPGERWILHRLFSQSLSDIVATHRPLLHPAPSTPSGNEAETTLSLILSNPNKSSTLTDWQVSLCLPAEAGESATTTSPDITVTCCTPTPRGLAITLAPAPGNTSLAPGTHLPIDLTLTPTDPTATLTPTDIRIS
ncbi:insecticidal delta-endotoxin Cry8Ea1 family protein [Streptomyces sp. NPDC055107]